MSKSEYFAAMQADGIPEGSAGLWNIKKLHLTHYVMTIHREKRAVLPEGDYTYLRRLTEGTMLREPPGEIVMEDTPYELRTHLNFVMRAYGRVLVSGLGLGCVIRGLLANPGVEHITCLENSKEVITMVAPYMPTERLTIIEANALEWTAKNKQPFDFAWHDLWTDQEKGEPHLDSWHTELLINCRQFVKRQGAWAYDRQLKEYLLRQGFQWAG